MNSVSSKDGEISQLKEELEALKQIGQQQSRNQKYEYKDWSFNKEEIDNYYNKIKDDQVTSHRDKDIIGLYSNCITNNDYLVSKHRCYQYIKYLMMRSDSRIEAEFDVYNC